MRISVGQFRPTGVAAENVATIERMAERAKDDGAELVLFPEESMFTVRHVQGPLAAAVDAGWSSFVRDLTRIAADLEIAVVAGGYEPSGTDRPYNTLVAIDATGRIVDTYRKMHLYDAFRYRESERITPGERDLSIAELGGLRFGMMTCYDLRFPEVSRALAVAGADVLLVPAAWFKGDHKIEHWQTLLKARAVENTVWVVAAGTRSDNTIGHSAIVDPLAIPVAYLGEEGEAIATAEVTRERIDEVREFLPVLANRRTDILG
ncbi:carbon-nitrogen hydrolase family protein [Citricoccus sp. SGAir0253]|uniref:carbon-nitrogen hydrolase family protein n=1 Tax=Citricoccus sp. SGAir0253 TaxID=2567881 RepID=UPI0010CD1D8C|nr:carbon-nitrogen hydrolase family protein [Citricoccus sp. SGAir0253]QCU76952.1 carbon-nitrogen hydrolase family protein [Citricoccus sp. SGAir0253]